MRSAKAFLGEAGVEESHDSLKMVFEVDYKHPEGVVKHVVHIVFREDPLYKAPDTLIYRVEEGRLVDIAHELPCHVRDGKPCVISDEAWVSRALPYEHGPIAFLLLQVSSFIKDFYEEDEKSFCSKSVF